MKEFGFYLKTKIYFGQGSIFRLSECVHPNCANVLVVTGKNSAQKYGHLDTLCHILNKKGITPILYDSISPNPKVEEVDDAVELCCSKNVDLIIGLGGGSALDAAKAVAVMYHTGARTAEVLSQKIKVPGIRLPLILIPTTAGTGAELSMGAILTDSSRKFKAGIRGESLLPDIAIVDPSLTYSMPLNLTMESGFDALAHAVETFVSVKANPITEIYSAEAMQRVVKHLPHLYENLSDIKSRQELSFASMLMGINLSHSSTCLPHRMQYPVGALTDTSHAMGLAAIYVSWLKNLEQEYFAKHNVDKLLRLQEWLGVQKDETISGKLESFIESIGLKISLKDMEVTEEMIPLLKERISGPLDNDPIALRPGIVDKIYRESL